MPNAACAAITVAPVCPALNSAAASPRATASAATRIDAGLRRSAAAGDSPSRRRPARTIDHAIDAGMPREFGSTAVRRRRPASPRSTVTRRGTSAVDDRARRVVTAHRVDGYADRGTLWGWSLRCNGLGDSRATAYWPTPSGRLLLVDGATWRRL